VRELGLEPSLGLGQSGAAVVARAKGDELASVFKGTCAVEVRRLSSESGETAKK